LVGDDFFAVAVKNNAPRREDYFAFFGNFLCAEYSGTVYDLHIEQLEQVNTNYQNKKTNDDISARV